MRVMCFLASLEDSTFQSLQNTMDKFEVGELKSQKLKKKDRVSLPDFGKLAYTIRPLMGLDPTAIKHLFQQVENGELSTAELKEEAVRIKKLAEVQQVFCNHMGCQSWEEAEQSYPEAANREVLSRFLPGFKPTDSRLQEYCWKLKKRREVGVTSAAAFTCGDAHGVVLTTNILNISNDTIRSKFLAFQGAELNLIDLPKEWQQDELSRFCGTLQNLNATANKRHYRLVVLRPTSRMNTVSEVLHKSGFFVHTEVYSTT